VTLDKKIVFRLGPCGFSLPIANLLEVREGIGRWFDQTHADSSVGLLGTLAFRGEQLLVWDLGAALGFPPSDCNSALTMLTIGHNDHHWGLVVGKVEGFFSTAEFVSRDLPELLVAPENHLYRRLDLWRGEPLVQLDPAHLSHCWGGA